MPNDPIGFKLHSHGVDMTIQMSLTSQLARQIIDCLVCVDAFRLHISKDGWRVNVVDPANWTSSIDGHPTGVIEDEIAVGIEISKIKDFLGDKHNEIASKIASLMVFDPDDGASPIEFTFIKSKYAERYELILKQGMFTREILCLNPAEITREPKLTLKFYLDYKLQISTVNLKRIVTKESKVGDYISFTFERINDNTVTFLATALDNDDKPLIATKLCHGIRLRDDAKNIGKSMFSMDYLLDIVNVLPSELVWLHLANNTPCKLEFLLGSSGTVVYFLAPRVED